VKKIIELRSGKIPTCAYGANGYAMPGSEETMQHHSFNHEKNLEKHKKPALHQ